MDATSDDDRRDGPDRRRRPTRPWDVLTTPARRQRHRRADVGSRPPWHGFVDRYDGWIGVLILMLLVLTITDGVLTMILIDRCCEEANPVMAVLIERGPLTFVLGKYAMTAVGLPVLLLFQNHRMFRTPFRVRYLLPAFVGLYLVLLVYQLGLLRACAAMPGTAPPMAQAVAMGNASP